MSYFCLKREEKQTNPAQRREEPQNDVRGADGVNSGHRMQHSDRDLGCTSGAPGLLRNIRDISFLILVPE